METDQVPQSELPPVPEDDDLNATVLMSHPGGLATLVVVGVPSTCHIPTLVGDMAGKRGVSQGSLLRVAPGVPSGSGWGPRALYSDTGQLVTSS